MKTDLNLSIQKAKELWCNGQFDMLLPVSTCSIDHGYIFGGDGGFWELKIVMSHSFCKILSDSYILLSLKLQCFIVFVRFCQIRSALGCKNKSNIILFTKTKICKTPLTTGKYCMLWKRHTKYFWISIGSVSNLTWALFHKGLRD